MMSRYVRSFGWVSGSYLSQRESIHEITRTNMKQDADIWSAQLSKFSATRSLRSRF